MAATPPAAIVSVVQGGGRGTGRSNTPSEQSPGAELVVRCDIDQPIDQDRTHLGVQLRLAIRATKDRVSAAHIQVLPVGQPRTILKHRIFCLPRAQLAPEAVQRPPYQETEAPEVRIPSEGGMTDLVRKAEDATDNDNDNDNDTLREVPHTSMRAWPYRQERRGHGPTKKSLSYR